MSLRPQDVLVLLKLVALGDEPWTYARLAEQLGMSVGEAHGAIRRASDAKLMRPDGRTPNRTALLEFLTHGIKYAFSVRPQGVTRGLPTAHAAEPLVSKLFGALESPYVWPDAHGPVRGEAIAPLFPSAPHAARGDQRLYELLALVDAIRVGRARERAMAAAELKSRLS